MILPKIRDPRLITIRRGGTLTDENHYLLAIWAAKCAEHVLPLFEKEFPEDRRPRKAVEQALAWARGEIELNEAKRSAFHSNAAASELVGAARFSAYSAGQAAAVGHVAAHELGAAAYAIKAVMAAGEVNEEKYNGRKECKWQQEQLPEGIKELVLEDQRNRNDICWNVFQLLDE
ncbi:MAG: Imm5 family immunity protein [Rectinemataceae bacterium]|nr:Imm5 family immunity protein [Rectinemataceae bacterium]